MTNDEHGPERSDTLRERNRKYREANRDWYDGYMAEYNRAYYVANREKLKAKALAYRAANPERHAENTRRRRALKRQTQVVPLSPVRVAEKMAYWGNKCWMCGSAAEQVDHVKPLAKGGAHMLSNLRPACASCNASKKARWDGVASLRAS